MRKKEVSPFVVIIISILFVVGGVMLLTEFEPFDSPTGMAHKDSHNPGGRGDSDEGDEGGDTSTGTTTTTTESGGGGGIQKVVGVIARGPENLGTLKRGTHLFLTQVYYTNGPSSNFFVISRSLIIIKLC